MLTPAQLAELQHKPTRARPKPPRWRRRRSASRTPQQSPLEVPGN
jgi:hypothetical protein